jgi:hypothetical protein
VTIELREPSLVEQIKRLAADQAEPAEKVLETAVQAHLDQLEREAIHAETEAFWDMHDDLVRKYEGKHVALCQGEVVDSDENASRLEKRVREQFGELPVLIAPVASRPRRDLRWIGGRIEANP